MNTEKKAEAFYGMINEVIETYKSELKPVFIVTILSDIIVNISLLHAPSELEGINFILKSVTDSIDEYKKKEKFSDF